VGRSISLYFAQFELEIPLESSYLICKSAELKIGTSKVRFGACIFLYYEKYYEIDFKRDVIASAPLHPVELLSFSLAPAF